MPSPLAIPSIYNRKQVLDGGVNGRPSASVAETNVPPTQFSRVYPIQSFFDASFQSVGAHGLLVQPQNENIVASTLDTSEEAGYSIGLAPWSETPIALEFKIGGQQGSSQAYVLKPGQILRPQGTDKHGTHENNFSGFRYGLPFGWLGGGLATLFVFKSSDSQMSWSSALSEVLFHCFRVTIRAAALAPPSPLRNWPTRFPWLQGFRGAAGPVALDQRGQPNVSIIETTSTVLRLNGNLALTAAGAPPDNYCRMVFYGTDALDHGSDGVTIAPAQQFFHDIFFPANQATFAMPAHNPLVAIPKEIASMASNTFGVTIDAPVGSPLIGATVDIARFGRL